METNEAKKYKMSFDYFFGLRSLFNSPNHQISFSQRYRFNDRFSLSQNLSFNPTTDDAGFYTTFQNDVIFARRDRKTIENVLSAKYNFNNKSGITFRARHYWSKVQQKQFYDLNADGTLAPTKHTGIEVRHSNFNIFNVDAVYSWQFAPGSFINIVWKEEGQLFDREVGHSYFKNFDRTLAEPQNNNLSFKIVYYLDYQNFKGKRRQ
jgi:hypothetical protein